MTAAAVANRAAAPIQARLRNVRTTIFPWRGGRGRQGEGPRCARGSRPLLILVSPSAGPATRRPPSSTAGPPPPPGAAAPPSPARDAGWSSVVTAVASRPSEFSRKGLLAPRYSAVSAARRSPGAGVAVRGSAGADED